VPVAYVQLRPGSRVAESELLAFAAGAIGERAAVPKAVRVVAQIPVTAVGKIFKPALVVREIEDVVRDEAEAAGGAVAFVDVQSDARRGLVAKVQLREDSVRLRTALGRYAFAAEVTEA